MIEDFFAEETSIIDDKFDEDLKKIHKNFDKVVEDSVNRIIARNEREKEEYLIACNGKIYYR